MSEVEGIQGGKEPHEASQDELKKYQNDYEKGLHLFKESFEQYSQPNLESEKKVQLKTVMDQALQVMNETASASLKEGQKEGGMKLNTDYQAFIQDPTTDNQKKVAADIQALSGKDH